MKTIEIYDGKTLIQLLPHALLQTDISLTGCRGGGENLGIRKNWRDMDSAEEKEAHKQTGISCIKSSSENHFECTGNTVTAYLDG